MFFFSRVAQQPGCIVSMFFAYYILWCNHILEHTGTIYIIVLYTTIITITAQDCTSASYIYIHIPIRSISWYLHRHEWLIFMGSM